MLENEQIPKELEPENIKLMLDQKAPAMKRKKISAVSRFTAIAAACAVISGTAVHFASKGDVMKKDSSSKNDSKIVATNAYGDKLTEHELEKMSQAPYMSGAKDYSEIYAMFTDGAEKQKEQYNKSRNDVRYFNSVETEENAAEADGTVGTAIPKTNGDDAFTEPIGGKGGGGDYSTTFNQEENVLEADIVKTDGKRIYSIDNYGKNSYLHITDANEGELNNLVSINITGDVDPILGDTCVDKYTNVSEMYIYDDMAIIIGTTAGQLKSSYNQEYKYYLDYKQVTFVAAYSLDDSHKNLGIYCQDGYYSDVRISPDGYMYLITNHTSDNYINVKTEDNIEAYIPKAGFVSDIKCIEAEDIYMPRTETPPCRNLSYSVIGSLDLNESEKMELVETKALAGAFEGYYGTTSIYCAPDNLYAVSVDYFNNMPDENVEYGHIEERVNKSYITRIAINEGEITPAASGEVEGYVRDQFSMSEYDGYFRVATTRDRCSYVYTKGEYYVYDDDYVTDDEAEESEEEISDETLAETTEAPEETDTSDADEETNTADEDISTEEKEELTVQLKKNTTKKHEPQKVEYGYYEYQPETSVHDNALYVLDLDLKQVGFIDNFGKDENVQSVSFGGDKAYVTTFRNTDPLFAIDLSNPASPTILSEFKMTGYSSYMQQWADGQLLGFGPEANEEGRTEGIKLTMFDNSDPNNLKAIDTFVENWNTIDNTDRRSAAIWDRKALLIDPKKNIIAYPVNERIYHSASDYSTAKNCYRFFRFEDGKFKELGTLDNDNHKNDPNDYMYGTPRAIYIGDYVYVIDSNGITSADIDTITEKSQVTYQEKYESNYDDMVVD